MYRRVIAKLRFDTPAKRDEFKNDIETKLSGVPAYDKKRTHSVDVDRIRHSVIDVRLENSSDAEDLYRYIKGKMDKIPVLSGRVTVHDCRHDEDSPFTSCQIDSKYEV